MILGSPLLGSLERRRSSGAEQLSCKQQVVGSNPTAGSANPQVAAFSTPADPSRGRRQGTFGAHQPPPTERTSNAVGSLRSV